MEFSRRAEHCLAATDTSPTHPFSHLVTAALWCGTRRESSKGEASCLKTFRHLKRNYLVNNSVPQGTNSKIHSRFSTRRHRDVVSSRKGMDVQTDLEQTKTLKRPAPGFSRTNAGWRISSACGANEHPTSHIPRLFSPPPTANSSPQPVISPSWASANVTVYWIRLETR